jgi:hypothetical protein
VLIDHGGVDDVGVDELCKRGVGEGRERLGEEGGRRKEVEAHLQNPQIAFQRVPDENGVVVEELGEVLLDVLERCRNTFELLGGDAGESVGKRISLRRQGAGKEEGTRKKLDAPSEVVENGLLRLDELVVNSLSLEINDTEASELRSVGGQTL